MYIFIYTYIKAIRIRPFIEYNHAYNNIWCRISINFTFNFTFNKHSISGILPSLPKTYLYWHNSQRLNISWVSLSLSGHLIRSFTPRGMKEKLWGEAYRQLERQREIWKSGRDWKLIMDHSWGHIDNALVTRVNLILNMTIFDRYSLNYVENTKIQWLEKINIFLFFNLIQAILINKWPCLVLNQSFLQRHCQYVL